jgi:hypothetical protein
MYLTKSFGRILNRTAIFIVRQSQPSACLYVRLFFAYHWLTFIYRHRRKPQKVPSGFNDFLFRHKVGGGLRQFLARYVTDKEHGKRYISARLGAGWTIKTLAVCRSLQELDAFEPSAYPVVIKPTHSSGRICVINNRKQFMNALPQLHTWLLHDYFAETLEENYAGLAKKIIVEPYLTPDMYLEGSIHCRDGLVRIVSVIDRFDPAKRRASFDRDYNELHVALGQPYLPLALDCPKFWDDLLVKAEILASEFVYIRLDFYASDETFIFGELTNLPGGGLARFSSKPGEKRFDQAWFNDNTSTEK